MVQIDIEMPKYCYDCPCHNGENGRCNITGDSIDDKRPFDCPLKEEESEMDDLISRQELMKKFADFVRDSNNSDFAQAPTWNNAVSLVESMPSAQSERKKGKWIKIPEFCGDDVSGFIDNHFSCSECKKEAEINSWGFYVLSDFCPHCGADMREKKQDG